MGKKRSGGQGEPARRKRGEASAEKDDKSKYFGKSYTNYVNAEIKAMFKEAVSKLERTTDLRILDQPGISDQTLLNALMLWVFEVLETPGRGVRAIEKELRPIFEKLPEFVIPEMIKRGKEIPDEFLTDDFRKQQAREKRRARSSDN